MAYTHGAILHGGEPCRKARPPIRCRVGGADTREILGKPNGMSINQLETVICRHAVNGFSVTKKWVARFGS
eukprot:5468097-Prymnesium_polylepis.2